MKLRKRNEPMYKILGKKVIYGEIYVKDIESIRMRNMVRKYAREQLEKIKLNSALTYANREEYFKTVEQGR